jgi:hypothetical protein
MAEQTAKKQKVSADESVPVQAEKTLTTGVVCLGTPENPYKAADSNTFPPDYREILERYEAAKEHVWFIQDEEGNRWAFQNLVWPDLYASMSWQATWTTICDCAFPDDEDQEEYNWIKGVADSEKKGVYRCAVPLSAGFKVKFLARTPDQLQMNGKGELITRTSVDEGVGANKKTHTKQHGFVHNLTEEVAGYALNIEVVPADADAKA